MDISPYYIDARNAITQPDKMVFLSQYFRRSWMPALGPLGTAIVIYLRGACYHNRKSGETRDTIQIAQRDIAAGCGSSVPTIKRELERNEALRRFVQISPEWERDGASGRVRQLENHYKVAMDDPLTEVDEARLREMVKERVNQERQAGLRPSEQPRKPIRLRETPPEETPLASTGLTACSKACTASLHDAVQAESSNSVNTACSNAEAQQQQGGSIEDQGPVAQNELLRPVAHFESTPIQNELLYGESLLKTTKKERTLNVGAGSTFVDVSEAVTQDAPAPIRLRSKRTQILDKLVEGLVAELHDFGSERRHHQLLDICQQRNLDDLPRQALAATRKRLASEATQGPLEKPGAYYQRILLALLEDHQVFVPKLGEPSAEEVHRIAMQSFEEAQKGA